MSSSNQPVPIITVEVLNKPLPVRMRLASFRARPGHRVGRRRSLPGLAPLLPVAGIASMALATRRGR